MNRRKVVRALRGAGLGLVLALSACSSGAETEGTSSVTIELTNVVGAEGSQLRAELRRDVGYFEDESVWQFLNAAVVGSPFAFTDTVGQLPQGDYTLVVLAGDDEKSPVPEAKGRGCEMSLSIGEGQDVTVRIDGLNEFGDKGYGDCNATVT